LGFLVWKQTIWQPWYQTEECDFVVKLLRPAYTNNEKLTVHKYDNTLRPKLGSILLHT
jgi:hypothetical protein